NVTGVQTCALPIFVTSFLSRKKYVLVLQMDTIDTVISVFTLFSLAKLLRAPLIIECADGAKRDLIVKVTLACTYPLTPFSLTNIDTKYSLLIISNPRFSISQVLF